MAWMGAAQIAAVALQFGAQVVLVRHLSFRDAGVYAVALAVVGALSLLQTLGLQALIVREETMTAALRATSFTINAALSLLLAAAILAVSYAGGAFLGDAGVQRVLAVLAGTPVIAIFSFLPQAMLERDGRFRDLALIGICGSVAGAITTATLAILGFRYMSAAYAQWSTALATLAAALVLGRRHASLAIGLEAWRRVLDFGLQMFAISGISSLGMRLSDVILGRLLGLPALGLYSRASGLNGLIWSNLQMLMGRVLLVDFAMVHRRGESLRGRYIETVDIVTALLWPAFAGMAVVAGPFIATVYGARWVSAAGAFTILALASMPLVAITLTYELFAATGELRTQTRIEFIRALFALATFAAGCFVSIEAAAGARLVESLFALILYRPFLNRMTDTSMRDFAPIFARNLALTLVAVLPAAGVMTAWRWDAGVPLPAIGAGVIAGMILWGAALVRLDHRLAAFALRKFRR